MDGKVNNHNDRVTGTENPHERTETARNREKVTVGCEMSVNQIFGLYSFENPVVTGESYEKLIFNHFLTMMYSYHQTELFSKTVHHNIIVSQCNSYWMRDYQIRGLEEGSVRK